MRAVDIIDKKKKRQELTKEEIDFLLEGYLAGTIPDYQMSAFLMAVYFNNMTKEELTYFTLKMRNSGDIIIFDNLDYYLVDKHSTGGVGDKVTVVLGPILAALGMATAKLSGKGLGHTGGTIDKFESIENFKFSLTKEELVEVAGKTGVGLMGYSDNIVPLDKKIYALRDVTATVDSIPLIASSIMSKKLAIQSDLIILDVKVGDGAFMKTIEDARELSRRMVEIGNSVGRKTIAVLTNMDEPLGYNIGNANEIKEGIEALKGHWSADLKEVVYEIVYIALKHKGEVETFEEASEKIDEVIKNGKALEILKDFISLSGGDGQVVNNYKLLPLPKSISGVYSTKDGFVEKIIGVDSKVQLFLNKCRELGTEESIDDFFDKLDEANEDFPPASNCWLKSMRTGGLSVFEKKMEEISNFNRIHASIEKFACHSKYSQLINFLEKLENEYKWYFGLYSSILNEAKNNVNDPEILEDRIKTKKKEIQDVYIKISAGIDNIYKKFTDNINGEGIIINEAEKMKNTYEKKLENFKNLPENKINNTTFNSMKTITFDAIDEAKKFRREIANKVIEECNQKLIQYTNDSSMIPADAYSPNFTEADFDTIDDEALKKSSGYNDIQSGITFKKTEKIPFHHLKEHVRLVANSISDRLNDEIIPTMIDNVVIYVQTCTEVYKEQLTLHKNELENEYQKLLDAQKNNNSIIANINDLERKIEIIKKESVSVSELKMELNNYVKEQ